MEREQHHDTKGCTKQAPELSQLRRYDRGRIVVGTGLARKC